LRSLIEGLGYSIGYVELFQSTNKYPNVSAVDYSLATNYPENTILEIKKFAINYRNSEEKTEVIIKKINK
jgi:uncharacterized membrane protein YfbV (UPF0208 family)